MLYILHMETKTCTKCNVGKGVEEFYKDSRASSGLRSDCKDCSKTGSYLKYHSDDSHRARRLATADAYIKDRRVKFQIRILTILKRTGCKDCGETNPIVLDFDHMSDKIASVSYLLRQHASWEALETEMSKCEVRCSNCHRKKTARERNYYATIDLDAL